MQNGYRNTPSQDEIFCALGLDSPYTAKIAFGPTKSITDAAVAFSDTVTTASFSPKSVKGFDEKVISEKITPENKFYNEDMLDYLLDDIIKQKAVELDNELKKDAEKRKRNIIDGFSKSIKQVLFNDPYTIILWKNGEKTIVKCQDGDEYDKEKGFALALIKFIFDNTNYFNTIFKDWVK